MLVHVGRGWGGGGVVTTLRQIRTCVICCILQWNLFAWHALLFLINTPTIQKKYASHKLRTLRFSLVFSEMNNAFHTSKFHCKNQCTVKPASWHQAQENMNEKCNLPQLNVPFTEGKTHIPWARNCGHKFGSWATNFSIVAQFLGPESGPCFGAHKTQTGAIQYWQQVCYCRRKLTAAHIRDIVINYTHSWSKPV